VYVQADTRGVKWTRLNRERMCAERRSIAYVTGEAAKGGKLSRTGLAHYVVKNHVGVR
jgi:hypothetical protein